MMQSNLNLDSALDAVLEASRRAGQVIIANLGALSPADIAQKQAADFVTRVDKEAEAAILGVITRAFPDHGIMAEEQASGSGGLASEYCWIIDPLDGTTNFIHSFPMFAVSIALAHEGRPILGVVFDPLKQECFTVLAGQGAFLNGQPIKVSHTAQTDGCLVATGFPFRLRHLLPPYMLAFQSVLMRVSDLRRAGSAALDLAYVAAGRLDGFFEVGLSPWDMAAGALLVQEAGGQVSDFRGEAGYLSTGNILGGTPVVHNMLLDCVPMPFKGIIDR